MERETLVTVTHITVAYQDRETAREVAVAGPESS